MINGNFHIRLDYIKPNDVNKFIEVAEDSIKRYGIGIDVPVLMRYRKISEN